MNPCDELAAFASVLITAAHACFGPAQTARLCAAFRGRPGQTPLPPLSRPPVAVRVLELTSGSLLAVTS